MIAVLAEFVCPSENTVFCKSCFPGFFSLQQGVCSEIFKQFVKSSRNGENLEQL